MKILHYVDENRLAWGETWIQLIKELSRQGVENHVVCKSGGTLAGRLADEGLSYDTCDVPVACLPWTAPIFGRIIDAVKPDIIHTRLSSAARIGGWWGKRKNIPVIQTVDKYPKAYYHKNATFLIACSQSIKDHMLSLGFPDEFIGVIANPIEIAKYTRDYAVRDSMRIKYGIQPDNKVLIAAGRFVEWKGFDVLIKAYSICCKNGDACFANKTKLFLLGDGEENVALRALVDSLHLTGNVIMPGFVQDIRPYLWASDIFVLPSKEPEPFGIILLEAMASGLAPVATRAGGPLDIIKDGINGWLVQMGKVDDLSNKLNEAILSEENISNISNAAVASMSHFDVSIVASNTIELYRNFIVN